MPNFNFPKIISFTIAILFSSKIFSQKIDSIYYFDNQLLMSSEKQNDQNILLSFFTRERENIIDKNSFEFSFIDSQFNMNRIIKVKNKTIFEDYWFTTNDTIFNEYVFGSELEKYYSNLAEYIAKNLSYPKSALKKNIEAKVILSFIVDKNGNITNLKALSKHGNGFENNALQILKSKNKFGIMMYQNRPVKVYFTIPVTYELTD